MGRTGFSVEFVVGSILSRVGVLISLKGFIFLYAEFAEYLGFLKWNVCLLLDSWCHNHRVLGNVRC